MRLWLLACFWIFCSFVTSDMLIQGNSDTLRALHNLLSRSTRSASRVREIRNEKDERREFAELLQRSLSSSSSSRSRRSVASTVVESARCEHVDLVDCSEYRTQEMSCMLTASGMTCCVCLGRLEYIKGAWKMLRNQDGQARRRFHVSRNKSIEKS